MDISIIRASVPKDARALALFDRKTFAKKEDWASPSYYLEHELRSFWLLRNGKRIGACCLEHQATFSPVQDVLSRRALGVLYITSTAILPKFQKIGFGALFKSWQIAYARSHGFLKIITNARKSNLASIHLNLKFGFVIVGESKHCYPNGETGIIMELNIQNPLT